ncbi:hypothetical protein Pla110_09830 [Polystyrenella longa]|uniref:Uncharacterized protein n=1 Tax=Polystyrenella longa TaxID=2528007 RepID=A0A518CJA0_9PLAN|nr:hypothetical protein [Polystyrenella longa]QDU79277.1 hypothetical protein Pla110_09830 [Polystyrenella longa]
MKVGLLSANFAEKVLHPVEDWKKPLFPAIVVHCCGRGELAKMNRRRPKPESLCSKYGAPNRVTKSPVDLRAVLCFLPPTGLTMPVSHPAPPLLNIEFDHV